MVDVKVSVVYVDKAVIQIGTNYCENIESFTLRHASNEPTPHVPILVMNTVAPVGWREAHRWVEGEVTIKSEAAACITPLNAVVATFTVKVTKTDTNQDTYTMTTAYFWIDPLDVKHEAEGLTTYKFVATSYAKT
jgi:hypothetical protein